MSDKRIRPIGIMDSGVGGLSVVRHVRLQMPAEHILYVADQAHVPYGPRSHREVQRFSHGITDFLIDQDAKIIVVACNAASAAALNYLRQTFPTIPFVGMEPAVKPGAVKTRQGKIGVLATVGTLDSERYANLMARYGQGVLVFEDPCQGLVEQIEQGDLDNSETENILAKALSPMLAAGADTIVLGCTHYPFVLPLIQKLAGPDVLIIDPAPAVAQQVSRVLTANNLLNPNSSPGSIHSFTSGNTRKMASLVEELLGYPIPVTTLRWDEYERLGVDGRTAHSQPETKIDQTAA